MLLWSSWMPLLQVFLISCAIVLWWFSERRSLRINFIAGIAVFVLLWTVAPDTTRTLTAWLYATLAGALASSRIHLFLVKHAGMILTGLSVVWLLKRACQTLWKPVPELISILGVEVPDAPDVSLGGIRSDAATVNWSRPPPNKPVQKFLIQVNGVVVGEVAANQEPAIVVTGLKPSHFYNVRVIAVAPNNFQAGSRVIRLRTFNADGRPDLGNKRVPSNFLPDEPGAGGPGDHNDENGGGKSSIPALETAPTADGVPLSPRDGGPQAGAGPRRNTVTRRHSPSTTSMDQALPSIRDGVPGQPEPTLAELTETFESIRRETEELTAAIEEDKADFSRQLNELDAEKQERKKEQRKKEDQTDKLKREANATERNMRTALQRKAQKEKQLKERQSERTKLHDLMSKWVKSMSDMQREQESFEQQKRDLEEERNAKVEQFRVCNGQLQKECADLETQLKARREEAKTLEMDRKRLPGGEDDAEWREKDEEHRRDWARRQKELQDILTRETRQMRRLDEQIHILSLQMQHIPPANYGMYNHANSSGVDFDVSNQTQLKRRSRNSASLSSVAVSSPLPAYSQIDPTPHPPPGFSSIRHNVHLPGFAPGPYMDLSADMPPRLDEAGIRASSAPLSPSATALLPSSILDDFDDEPVSPDDLRLFSSFLPPTNASPEGDPQSPASSGRSLTMFSSPHGSSHNLPVPFSGDNSDRISLGGVPAMSSPGMAERSTNRLGSLFSLTRSRQPKITDEDGPALGTLKHGQSQSFPRQLDDPETLANKRRISLSGRFNILNRNSVGGEIMEGVVPGSRPFSAKNLFPFSSSTRAAATIFGERDPSSPRPTSIASSDFPRPSTDSSSIWGPPADPSGIGKASRIWSTSDAPWSRNPSRRPSVHGSPSALKTTLASADDEILDEDTMPDASQVGVIGSKPPTASSKSFARLNPNAPAFIGSLFRAKPDKEKDKEKEKDVKDKEKTKLKDKDKSKDKNRSKLKEQATPEIPIRPSLDTDSPPDSRKSRDTLSVHTQTSVSESRESLSLDMSMSNTPSEPTSNGMSSSVKDQENVVRKLFRKGSSSKFSLPARLGGKDGSSLFKKGPGSTASAANSDRGGISFERSSIGDLEEPGILGSLAVSEDGSNSGMLGRSYDSVTSSPGLAPTSAPSPALSGKAAKEGKSAGAATRWLSFKKGKKEKESLDLERDKIQIFVDGPETPGANGCSADDSNPLGLRT